MSVLEIKIDISALELSMQSFLQKVVEDTVAQLANSKGMADVHNTRPLNMAEACQFLRLSRGTVQKLAHQGLLEGTKSGTKWRFEQSALNKYLYPKK